MRCTRACIVVITCMHVMVPARYSPVSVRESGESVGAVATDTRRDVNVRKIMEHNVHHIITSHTHSNNMRTYHRCIVMVRCRCRWLNQTEDGTKWGCRCIEGGVRHAGDDGVSMFECDSYRTIVEQDEHDMCCMLIVCSLHAPCAIACVKHDLVLAQHR